MFRLHSNLMLRYLGASIIGTLANFLSRFLFSLFYGFTVSLVLSTYVGMVIIYALSYKHVFQKEVSASTAFFRFVLVAHLGMLAVILCASLTRSVLSPMGLSGAVLDGVAHGAGIAAGFALNYLGHGSFSFVRHTVFHRVEGYLVIPKR